MNIYDKYQRMQNARSKYREDLDIKDEEKDEFRADAVGLYAMTRAGYAPRAFATNLERVTDRTGWKGNFLTDMLDATSLPAMRIRAAQRIASHGSGCLQEERVEEFLRSSRPSSRHWSRTRQIRAETNSRADGHGVGSTDPARLNWYASVRMGSTCWLRMRRT